MGSKTGTTPLACQSLIPVPSDFATRSAPDSIRRRDSGATLRAKHPTAILKREKAPHEAAHPLVRPSRRSSCVSAWRDRTAHQPPTTTVDCQGRQTSGYCSRRANRQKNPSKRRCCAGAAQHVGNSRVERLLFQAMDCAGRCPVWGISDHVLAKRLKRTFLAVQTRPLGDTVLGQETRTSPGSA